MFNRLLAFTFCFALVAADTPDIIEFASPSPENFVSAVQISDNNLNIIVNLPLPPAQATDANTSDSRINLTVQFLCLSLKTLILPPCL